jgi:hypothetical protein
MDERSFHEMSSGRNTHHKIFNPGLNTLQVIGTEKIERVIWDKYVSMRIGLRNPSNSSRFVHKITAMKLNYALASAWQELKQRCAVNEYVDF